MNLAVIIPYYNGGRFIQRCIDSLGAITSEQIIVVNNSDDNLPLEVSATVINTQEKKIGYSKAVNIGLKKVYEDNDNSHVLILNQDAYFKKGHFNQMAQRLGLTNNSTYSPLTNFASPMIYTEHFTEPMPFIVSRYFKKGIPKNEIALPHFVAVALFASVKMMKSLNGFDEKYFMYYEDNDLFARCKIKNPVTAYPNFHVAHYNPELETGRMNEEKKIWIHKSKIRFLWVHGPRHQWILEYIKSMLKQILKFIKIRE